jgi:glucose-6-phosphate isomerase
MRIESVGDGGVAASIARAIGARRRGPPAGATIGRVTQGLPDTLAAAARALAATPLTALFARDASRVASLTFAAAGLTVDLSKQRVTPEALALLVAHAETAGIPHWIEAMLAGERINLSENRSVLHTALRREGGAPVVVDGRDVMPDVRATRARIAALATSLRDGTRRGATGAPIRHVIAIGIGGSDLGPRLCVDALANPASPPPVPVRFVSNVDPDELDRALAGCDPATTLAIVESKTFTTQETLANASALRAWLRAAMPGADTRGHFIGVTANVDAAKSFGVDADAILPMWDWVGGRYSLWSAVGLPIAIACGPAAFDALLAGAAALDAHFATAPLARNLPALMGLCDWFNVRAYGAQQRLVVPYARALSLLPSYLQQLTMESNGKSVTRDGAPVDGATEASLWGGAGTDGQHAYFQWLHQGTHPVPVEFVVAVDAAHDATAGAGERQSLLVANALAQAQALMQGRDGDAAHRCPGNRPSTVVMMPRVDARHLGALIALWEHRTFVEGCLYGINSFDQFGVELGKSLAQPIAAALTTGAALPAATDASTRALVAHVLASRSVIPAKAGIQS